MQTGQPILHLARWLSLACTVLSACESEPTASPVASVPGAPVLAPPAPRPTGKRAAIPEGSFSSGSEPALFERDPDLEPRLTRTALGRFEIDVEPYPGDGQPPLVGLGRDQAAERCADRGGRLCTELEWERACKGPESQPYASGPTLDPSCLVSPGCPSGFAVWGMGSAREWTASELPGRALVRGAGIDAPAEKRRCAHREPSTFAPRDDVRFRCCYGAPNGAAVVLPRLAATFGKVELPIADLAQLLAADPVTERLARDLSYFDDPGASQKVVAKGTGDKQGFLFTTSPLAWNPAPGVDLLVVTARSGDSTSFVVVFDALGDGTRRLASSFIMQNETGPVTLAYNGYIRPRIHFSTCWGCPGETGKILYRDPDRAVILQP